ncbi:MAG: hypothetical protein SVX43_11260 [Cyanobacteriota bacterium]|nr:hypothetical protein [Cyanobacteriota bacterium]
MNNLFNPALLVAVGIHFLLLAIPISGGSQSAEPNPEESPTEEESQATELPSPAASPNPTALPSPQLKTPALKSPTVAARSPVPPTPKPATAPSPGAKTIAQSTRPPASRSQPTSRTASNSNSSRRRPPAQKNSSNANPEARTTTRDRSQETTPVFSDSATNTTSPSPTQPKQPQAVAPSPAETDPFAKFPPYPSERASKGSLHLTDRETYAFNTSDNLLKVLEFYDNEIPKDVFEIPTTLDYSDLTVYEIQPKSGGKSQYLHMIPFKGRIVILLLSEELSEVDRLKEQATKQLDEKRNFLTELSPMKRIRQRFRSGRFIESQTAKE